MAQNDKFIGSGQRNKLFTWWERGDTGSGIEPTPTYTSRGTRWASLDPLSVRETLVKEDATIFSDTTHKLRIAWQRPTPPIESESSSSESSESSESEYDIYTGTSNNPTHEDVFTLGPKTYANGVWTGAGRMFEILGEGQNIGERNRELLFMVVERK